MLFRSNPNSFFVTTTSDSTLDIYVNDRTVDVDNETYVNRAFDTVFTGNRWVLES